MDISLLYRAVNRHFDDVTPLPVDCGSFCGKLCCQSSPDEDNGMYLFPGEEVMFRGVSGFRILDSELCYGNGRHAKLLCCDKPCDRRQRPLSCRIFPLVPYYRKGSAVRVMLDPRADFCPLTHPIARPYLDQKFQAEVLSAFRLLVKVPEVADFLEALSDVLDDFNIWKGSSL